MKLNFNCITCNINQVIQVMDMLEVDRITKENIMREALSYLESADYSKCNPEIIGGTWNILTKYAINEDIYHDIKVYYNMAVLEMEPEIKNIIEQSTDKLGTALKIAIAGNLIDFAAKHAFDIDMLKSNIQKMSYTELAIDDSNKLFAKLSKAKKLLYLGDNCGEVCLDKIFMEYMKHSFPDIEMIFGVRGKAIVNDVTNEDAKMVKMNDIAQIIDNGDGSLGTVIERVSKDFQKVFYDADVVIAKGQGNFESLSEVKRDNIFFLFMAKCDPVAKILDVEKMSIVCVEHKREKDKI